MFTKASQPAGGGAIEIHLALSKQVYNLWHVVLTTVSYKGSRYDVRDAIIIMCN